MESSWNHVRTRTMQAIAFGLSLLCAADPEWANASTTSVQSHDLVVQINRATIATVQLRTLGQLAESNEKHLLLAIQLNNRNKAKKVEYTTWQNNAKVRLADEFKNTYRAVSFGVTTEIIGNLASAAIYADKPAVDILVFERPVEDARELFLELPAVGGDGTIRFLIPAFMVGNFRPFVGPPDHEADAFRRWKLAHDLYNSGDKAKARAVLKLLIAVHPKTKAGAAAPQLLKDWR